MEQVPMLEFVYADHHDAGLGVSWSGTPSRFNGPFVPSNGEAKS